MTPLAQALAASPDLFPAALDPGSGVVTLWRLSRDEYQEAAFLDGRIAAGKTGRKLPLADLKAAVDETILAEDCGFIFHIGHVGSTLLSRLLGKHRAFFSLREPDVLRTLALIRNRNSRDAALPTFLKLWSRTYETGARALIKATSFVGEIAADILAYPFQPRALAIGVAPEVYLATIFGGENAPAEARALAPMRCARMESRLASGTRLHALSEGEIVALGWACETLCLAEAATSGRDRVLMLDFENFLANPDELLARIFAHFGVDVSETDITNILAESEMRTYSKAPEYAYNAETRRAVLAEGRTQHAAEIRQGLQWLERVKADNPQLAGPLSLFD